MVNIYFIRLHPERCKQLTSPERHVINSSVFICATKTSYTDFYIGFFSSSISIESMKTTVTSTYSNFNLIGFHRRGGNNLNVDDKIIIDHFWSLAV